jgi:diguanylate cyclase (GGDEF)-like protein/PAS domain S-box-containing protein
LFGIRCKKGAIRCEKRMTSVFRPPVPPAAADWPWHRLLLANAAIVAVYLGTGLASRLLDLPPGYATPVFPPAGVAFALTVLVGWRVLPGITLGAALLHLPNVWLAPEVAPSIPLAATLAATFGSALQAWLGARWFRRLVHPALDSARDVTRFVLLAPLACVVSASLNVPVLALLRMVPAPELGPTWINWWAGDTIGVLLAGPLTWMVCGRPRMLWRRRARPVAIPLALAAAVVVAMYRQAVDWEDHQHLEAYRLEARQVADVLQAELHEHERFVGTFARTLGAEDQFMPRDKFLRIAGGYADDRRDIAGITWMVPVEHGDRAAFEAWVRRNVDADFTGVGDLGPGRRLVPAAQRVRYLPLLYVWPHASAALRGLDFLSAFGRIEAAARAIRSARPTATGPIVLADTGRPGVILLRAVREAGGPLVGVLGVALDTQRFVDQAVHHNGETVLDASLADVTVPGQARRLAGDIARRADRSDYSVRLGFAGRSYLLRFSPTAAYMEQQRGLVSWIVLTAGLLLTALLGALLLLMSGERAQVEAQVRDRTDRLRDREARLQAILDNAADAILTVDAAGVVVSANAASASLFRYPLDALPGLPFTRLVPGAGDEPGPELLSRLAAAAPEQRRQHELDGIDAGGEPVPLALSVSPVRVSGERLYVCIARDLTEQRRSQASIHRLAHHDPLTGLENRNALGMRLEQQLAQARRSSQPLAVLFIDLDHFKKINDTHGHQVGDRLLVAAAGRMRELLRDVDTLARLGGDEFLIVLGGPLTPDSVSAVALRLVESLQQPYELDGITAHIGASVGVALFPGDGGDAETLVRHADVAMYAAKREGRNNFQFFSPAMNAATHEHLMLENRMWAALEHGGFDLHLQAQVQLDTGRVIGAEVLLRWHDAELGEVEPSRFIPIAEESGLILPLGDWVLSRTMALLSEWRHDGLDGLGGLRLAVNLSARQFTGGSLVARLDQLLAQHPIDPSRLELEITESAAMRDPENTQALLLQLRARGFKLAIDDFGTGYSSLAYLKLFAIDRIKIDRGFVRDIETNPNDAAIVDATIGLAHSLGLTVVAEGVETPAQWGFLRDKRSDEAQGYLFARPMPAAEFRDFLRAQAQPVPGP